MAQNRYVTVRIIRNQRAVTQAGFGTALILSDSKDYPFTKYTALTAVEKIKTDFGPDSKEAKLAAMILRQTPRVSEVAVYGVEVSGTATNATELRDALTELVKKHGDFYYVTSTNHTDAVITAIGEWNEQQERLYLASTSTKNLGDTIKYRYTAVLVHENPDTFPAEGWVGTMAPRPVGTASWTFKNIDGITPSDYDADELKAIEDANGNAYIKEGGVEMTSNGRTLSGESIDYIQTEHYLLARLREAAFGLLVNVDKVPYNQAGLDQVQGVLSAALQATPDGMLDTLPDGTKDYEVIMPALSSISGEDKFARILNGVYFRAAALAGIEKINIEGVLEIA